MDLGILWIIVVDLKSEDSEEGNMIGGVVLTGQETGLKIKSCRGEGGREGIPVLRGRGGERVWGERKQNGGGRRGEGKDGRKKAKKDVKGTKKDIKGT